MSDSRLYNIEEDSDELKHQSRSWAQLQQDSVAESSYANINDFAVTAGDKKFIKSMDGTYSRSAKSSAELPTFVSVH